MDENKARTCAGCRPAVVLLLLSCVSWWLIPTGATKPRTCTLGLAAHLRGDALNTPSAVDEPGSPVDLCSDFVHAGTTFKSHYNINFTLFEAPGLACDDGGHDVLKYTRSEKPEQDTIYACNSYKMGRKPQSSS